MRLSQFLLMNLHVIVDHICLRFASDVQRAKQVATIKSQWIYVLMLIVFVVNTWTGSRCIRLRLRLWKMSRQINYPMLSLLAQYTIDLHTGFHVIRFYSAKVELSENLFKLTLEATPPRGCSTGPQCPLSQYSIAHKLRWVCCAVYFPTERCLSKHVFECIGRRIFIWYRNNDW